MRYLITCLASLLLALPAAALNVPPTPTPMCAVDNTNEFDRAAIGYMHLAMQGDAELKALFADCHELENLRSRSQDTLNNYGVIIVQKVPFATPVDRTQALAVLATAAGLSGVTSAQSVHEANGVPPSDRRASPSYHRLLKQTPEMVIIGGEQRHTGSTLQYAVAVVSAITLVNNQMVVANFYAPMKGPDGFAKLSLMAESYIASMLAANK